MAEFEIICPHCGASLTADEQWIGMEAPCPECSKSIPIEKPHPAAPALHLKSSMVSICCSFCQAEMDVPEELIGQTVECPACHRNITAEQPRPDAAPVSAVSAAASERKNALEKEQRAFLIKAVIKKVFLVLLLAGLGIGGFFAYKHFTAVTPQSLSGNQLYIMTQKRLNNGGAAGIVDIIHADLLPVISTKKTFFYRKCGFRDAVLRQAENELYTGFIIMQCGEKKTRRPFQVDRRNSFCQYSFPFKYADHPDYLLEDGPMIFDVAVQIDKSLQGWRYKSGTVDNDKRLVCTISNGSETKTIVLKAEQITGDDNIGRVWVEFPEKK